MAKPSVVHFFEFFRDEYGIKIAYRKGQREIFFYEPERMQFIYRVGGVMLRDLFVDEEGELHFPRAYKDIKRKIYEALPQFFRTFYQFNYYAKKPNKNTPEPFAEFVVFAYSKQPMRYPKDVFEEIEVHLRELAAIDRKYTSELELDVKHYRRWKYSIDWDLSIPGFEQDKVLTPIDMKAEHQNFNKEGVGGYKALNYVHRLTIYLGKSKHIKGIYREDYWQNAEIGYTDELDEKLHHIKAHLISRFIPRIDYKPRYKLKFGLKWS